MSEEQDPVITSEIWIEIFGSLQVEFSNRFELVFEPNKEEDGGDVWIQTLGAEDDWHGSSSTLDHIKHKSQAIALRSVLIGDQTLPPTSNRRSSESSSPSL